MEVGDLVKVKQENLDYWASTRDYYGLITEIKKDFYSHSQGMDPRYPVVRSDKLIILWNHGGIAGEPENYVEKIK